MGARGETDIGGHLSELTTGTVNIDCGGVVRKTEIGSRMRGTEKGVWCTEVSTRDGTAGMLRKRERVAEIQNVPWSQHELP